MQESFQNPFYYLVGQSDAVSKVILLILLCMSILSLAFFIMLALVLRRKYKDLDQRIDRFDAIHSLEDLRALTVNTAGSLTGFILGKTLMLLRELSDSRKHHSSLHERVTEYHDQLIDDLCARDEAYLPFFSTVAAVAPLLGLFGTVWGLVQSFMAIGLRQSADIAVIAPGIAQALVTTLAGLIVAIPALVMHNYLAVRIRAYEQRLIRFTDQIRILIQQQVG